MHCDSKDFQSDSKEKDMFYVHFVYKRTNKTYSKNSLTLKTHKYLTSLTIKLAKAILQNILRIHIFFLNHTNYL